MMNRRLVWMIVFLSTLHMLLVVQARPILKPSSNSQWPSGWPFLSQQKKKKKRESSRHCLITSFWENLVTGQASPGPKALHHWLYWMTAVDAIENVLRNEYTTTTTATTFGGPFSTAAVYSKLFYFARLRPRLLYAVGAILRALQLCTPLGRVLDPTIGVGAGINLCGSLANSRWVKPLILGFATTKFVWKWLGARQPQGRAFVPISLSLGEWQDKTRNDASQDFND
mmetsp:Transcript_13931/g.30450  ORF Transcript_13931/g.30450 Transcript_13931/m.30450 type:complete len:227 (+) Transcript_13931:179-859(+)